MELPELIFFSPSSDSHAALAACPSTPTSIDSLEKDNLAEQVLLDEISGLYGKLETLRATEQEELMFESETDLRSSKCGAASSAPEDASEKNDIRTSNRILLVTHRLPFETYREETTWKANFVMLGNTTSTSDMGRNIPAS